MTYEQPTNELIRTCLRLEILFKNIQTRLQQQTYLDSKLCCENLIEIINIIDRNDLKTLFHKELSRHIQKLQQYLDSPGADIEKIQLLLNELDELAVKINLSTNFIKPLKENEFLNSIRMYLGNPGGVCPFDNPGYHLFLNQPQHIKHNYLTTWLATLTDIHRIITLLLKLIRSSSILKSYETNNGHYQTSLDAKTPCQLIRVQIAQHLNCYPEISVGRHHLSIRFLKPDPANRPQQLATLLEFQMACCLV
ncbi:MAG: cell division protein ZapD [Pseudomonadota bacterium]